MIRVRVPFIALAAIAVVTACSNDPVADEARNTAALPTINKPTAKPYGAPPVDAAPATPSDRDAASTNIPAALRGRWGLTPMDCTTKQGDAKGLLTITADKLEFYESVATLGPIREVDADSIGASFDFTGEGESWIQEVVLSTPDGGKTLVREDIGPRAQPGPFTYTKCPAG